MSARPGFAIALVALSCLGAGPARAAASHVVQLTGLAGISADSTEGTAFVASFIGAFSEYRLAAERQPAYGPWNPSPAVENRFEDFETAAARSGASAPPRR